MKKKIEKKICSLGDKCRAKSPKHFKVFSHEPAQTRLTDKVSNKKLDWSKTPKLVTEFDTGAIRDAQDGKPDFIETLSYSALRRYIGYMTEKKKKYGAGNFKKGIPIESYEKSLMRHIDKYMRNKYENGDDEKAEDHLSAMVFNILGIMHEEEQDKIKRKAP